MRYDRASGRGPTPRQQIVDAIDRVSVCQALQNIYEPALPFDIIRLCGGDQGAERGPSFRTTLRPGIEVVLATKGNRADGALDSVGIEINPTIVKKAGERQPTCQAKPGSP
jgi:hypothetical protein